MRIWLASYPRSGNTMFRIWWHHHFRLPTYSNYKDWRLGAVVKELVGHSDRPPKGDPLALWKTHDLEEDTFLPAFYLVRDGREVCVSYAKYLGVSVKQVIRGNVKFGSWSEHVKHWTSRINEPQIIRYEDMLKSDRTDVLMSLALKRFGLYIPPTEDPPPGFASLKEVNPSFFRSGREASWKIEMTQSDQALFWKLHGLTMERLGYSL